MLSPTGMVVYFETHVPFRELVTGTIRDSVKNDALGLAAQLAYYFFLALFPALMFLVALASFFPLYDVNDELMRLVAPVAPREVSQVFYDQLIKLSNSNDTGVLSMGLIMALWSSSAAMVSIIYAMNRAYDIEETRPWWKVRLLAIVLTIGLALFILLSFGLVVAGPWLADYLEARLGLGAAFGWIWKILQWPLVFALTSTGFALVYYFAPDAEQEWAWITPGAVTGTLLWLIASLGFRFYVVNFGNFDEAYGTLGAVILTLLWFYLTGLSMVIGAELNSVIEREAPWVKNPPARAPGERKRLGLAASRAWKDLHAA